ncbi:hypothetical protein CHELA40_12960 [Chelatococcus asaccharovorans]|nr:hypothetical protein CHELA40_12960 [Chelatococcus asaccharovorans]CAH1681057.1 hypothetical protein CHELA17_62659 [Chelatococcus asaccharovorans]
MWFLEDRGPPPHQAGFGAAVAFAAVASAAEREPFARAEKPSRSAAFGAIGSVAIPRRPDVL